MICKDCACDADVQAGWWFEACGEDCVGHRSCKGCDCQHRPVKDGQVIRPLGEVTE